jgi:hypothetical protein
MPPRGFTLRTPVNPLLQVVYFILGGIVLIGVVLMGAVILAIALGVALILGVVIYARVWWLRRKLARAGHESGGPADVLEVEYTVVDERDDRSPRD